MSSIDNIQQLLQGNETPGNGTPLSFMDMPKRFSEPIQFSREDCSAIPFIKFTPSQGKFELNPEAAEFLQSLEGIKLGVVAVCGKYRTGKSYLLNKLFVETYFQNLNNTSMTGTNNNNSPKKKFSQEQTEDRLNSTLTNGFQVSPTINPCTKGLWIWRKVIYSDQNDCPMIVIDTEGLGAFDEDENHDAKIFLLALLLSSMIIYNSVGTIDETALNNLSLVINLSKKIQLQNALKEQKGCSEAVEQKNRIRRLLKHFFQERDCCTLIRPTEKERDLQDLAKLKENQLRKDFIEQMNRLKQKVMTKIKVKVMNGHQLNGPMILELANSYIEAINSGQVPNIESAWSNVCTFEQERAFKESVKFFEQEVKERLKNCFEDIGQGNVKTLLNQIKDEAVYLLRSNFLGDQKASDAFEKKLLDFIKQQTKIVVKETQNNIDEQITRQVTQLFQEQIEQKVRQGSEEIDTLEKLSEEIDHLLTVIQIKFVNDTERAEHLFRKHVQSRLFRVIDVLNEKETRIQNSQIRLLQEKLKIKEEAIQQYKDEKKDFYQESQFQKERIEAERLELLRTSKLQEQKLKQSEQKLHELELQLMHYKNKDFKHTFTQTTTNAINQVLFVDQKIQTTIEEVHHNRYAKTACFNTDNEQEKNYDQDQIPFNYIQQLKPQHSSQLKAQSQRFTQPLNLISHDFQYENEVQLLSPGQQQISQSKLLCDIVQALNKQTKQIQQNMSKELSQLVKSNQMLSKAVERAEKRSSMLEKKLEKKSRYEEIIKNCQRLQCNGCSKLYTPMLFVTHFMLCKKQQQLRSSIIQENLKIQEEHKEDSQSVNEEQQFLAKIVDMKQIYIDLRDGSVTSSHDGYRFEVFSNSDELVTIMGATNTGRLQIPSPQNQQFSTVQFKFCVLYKGSIWYVHRSLLQIKQVMNKIQRDKENNEQEQCQIAKWLLEIERNEAEENYQRIADIIETFFAMVYRKIVINKKTGLEQTLLKYPKIKIENVDDHQNNKKESASDYIQDFLEFFEIEENLNQRPSHWANIQPIQTNDDEVIVQMTYDDNEDNKTESEINIIDQHCRSSAMGGTAISDLCLGQRPQGGFRATTTSANGCGIGINHSTMHLDGEKSVNDNSSLHFVSFFSVAEELLMKKNLLLASSQHQSQQDNNEILEYDDEESSFMGQHEQNQPQQQHPYRRNQENYLNQSPSKSNQKRNPAEIQPFYSISNRQSNYKKYDHTKTNMTKTQTIVQRPSLSPQIKNENKNTRESRSSMMKKQQTLTNNKLNTSKRPSEIVYTE